MSRKIEIEGELICQSSQGTLLITASAGDIQLNFSDERALKAAISFETVKTFLKYRKSSRFLSQDVIISVKGNEWLSLRDGRIRARRPISTVALFIDLWRNR